MRGYLVVEGHGDVLAANNLVNRLWNDLGLPSIHWAQPIRGIGLVGQTGLSKACALVRTKGDAEHLLIIRDEDDRCPKILAPQVAGLLVKEALPFPVAVVLLHREFEALFLPCIHLLAGRNLLDERGISRPGLRAGTRFSGNPESIRGVKEWLGKNFTSGRRYKPTLDQLPLTQMLDFDVLRASGLPCFEKLERALRFLAQHRGQQAVYPTAAVPSRPPAS